MLCLFNTNDKLPCLRGAGSFWKATLCWQTKQMQGRDTKSVYWRVYNHWVDLKLKEENNGSGRCSDQKVQNACVKGWLFFFLCKLLLWIYSQLTSFDKTDLINKMYNSLHWNMFIQIFHLYCPGQCVFRCLTGCPFCSTEEEEEEEIAQPQQVVETPTEKPDQKEEEEGTPLPVIKYNSDTVTHFSSSRHFTITYTIVEWKRFLFH